MGFHYFRNKDSVSSQYLLSKFYLKLPLEELTKKNNNERFQVLSLFVSHVLGSKVSASHTEPYQLIPEGKANGRRIRG